MNLFAIDKLTTLATESSSTCISIYTPMERLGAETQQNPIRFKNLMREAQSQLLELGMSEQDANNLLKPAHNLDTYDFWQHQSDGLAILLSPNQFHYYRLPIAFAELTVVTDHFHLKPLLQLLSGDGQFYILGLSQNQVRLFQGTRYYIHEISLTDIQATDLADVANVPNNMAEALQDDEPEKSLQFHTGPSSGGSGSDRAAVFHGQGGGSDDPKDDLLRYFRQVNSGLEAFLKNEKAPLILAGVDYLLPIYQQANTYPHLMPHGITGNPEMLKPEELHTQAWEIVQPDFERTKEAAINRYQELHNTKKTANTIEQVIPAAYFQRVEALFVPVGEQVWGLFDPEANSVQMHTEHEAGDRDLLDLAALHTLTNGGTVYAVEPGEVPEDKAIAAIFRY
jgi:hypothetical protein